MCRFGSLQAILACNARQVSGQKKSQAMPGFWEFGGAREDRTPDLVIANDALSQLSYGPTRWEAHYTGPVFACQRGV